MILTKLVKFLTRAFIALVPFAVMGSDAVADPNVTVLAFGLVGSQSVFESEAKGAAIRPSKKSSSVWSRTSTRYDPIVDLASDHRAGGQIESHPARMGEGAEIRTHRHFGLPQQLNSDRRDVTSPSSMNGCLTPATPPPQRSKIPVIDERTGRRGPRPGHTGQARTPAA
jgi:hypothetical protein